MGQVIINTLNTRRNERELASIVCDLMDKDKSLLSYQALDLAKVELNRRNAAREKIRQNWERQQAQKKASKKITKAVRKAKGRKPRRKQRQIGQAIQKRLDDRNLDRQLAE